MTRKQNYIFLGIAAVLVAVAIANLMDSGSSTGPHGKVETGLKDGANTGTSAPGIDLSKPVPDNHDQLMQIQTLKDMLEKNPNDAEHWVMLGNLYFDIGQFDNAIDPYRRALVLTPDNHDVRVDYAVSLFNTGRSQDALDELTRVVSKNPAHQTAYFNLGVISSQMGQAAQARQYWSKVVAINPNTDLGRKAQQALTGIR